MNLNQNVRWLKTDEFAMKYSISSNTVHKWCKRGLLHHVRLPKSGRIRIADIGYTHLQSLPKLRSRECRPIENMALFRTCEVSKLLKLDKATVRDNYKAGYLRGIRIGNQVWYTVESVREYICRRIYGVAAVRKASQKHKKTPARMIERALLKFAQEQLGLIAPPPRRASQAAMASPTPPVGPVPSHPLNPSAPATSPESH